MAERYTPTGRLDAGAFAKYALALAGAGAIAALAAHAIARSMALLLVLPALQGVAVGLAAIWAVRRLRIERPGIAAMLAGWAAALSLAGHAVADYRAEQAAWSERCARVRSLQDIAAADAPIACDDRFGPRAFLLGRYQLETGTDRGEPRSGVAVALLELALAIGLAAALAARAARDPICPTCGAWRVERGLGSCALGAAAPLVDALLAGDAGGAAALLEPPDTREQVVLALLACPSGDDGDGGVLRISERTVDRRRTLVQRKVADLLATGEEVSLLRGRLAALERDA